jgi:O-antigen/teichoic acid export membrane protein
MTTHSRSKLAIWNFGSSFLSTIFTVVFGLVSSPLVSDWVGDQRFGAFRIITNVFAYLLLLDLGLGAALRPMLARSLNRGDRDGLAETLAAGVRAYLIVTLASVGVGLAITAASTWLVPVEGAQARLDLRLGFLVSLLPCLVYPLLPFKFLTEARQRSFRVNLFVTAQNVGIVVLTMLLAYFARSWGIVAQAVGTSAVQVAFAVLIAWDCFRGDRGLIGRVLTARPNREVWASVWSLSWPSLVVVLCGRISYYSDNVIIGNILGPSAVTVLFFTQRLSYFAQMQLTMVGAAAWAGLVELHNQGERERFRARIVEIVRLVTIASVALLGPIIAFNRYFVALWKGAEYNGGEAIIVASSVVTLLLSLAGLYTTLIVSTGHARRLVTATVLAAGLNVVLSVVLTKMLGQVTPMGSVIGAVGDVGQGFIPTKSPGLLGPLLGSIVSLGVLCVVSYPRILRSLYGLPPASIHRAVLPGLAVGSLATGLLWWFAGLVRPSSWFVLLPLMGLSTLALVGLSYLLLLDPEERRLWRDRFAGALRIRRPRQEPVGVAGGHGPREAEGAGRQDS